MHPAWRPPGTVGSLRRIAFPQDNASRPALLAIVLVNIQVYLHVEPMDISVPLSCVVYSSGSQSHSIRSQLG
jgi:hypothetical protein